MHNAPPEGMPQCGNFTWKPEEFTSKELMPSAATMSPDYKDDAEHWYRVTLAWSRHLLCYYYYYFNNCTVCCKFLLLQKPELMPTHACVQ